MKTYTEVEKLVYSMMVENTGRHLLDSGGIYGRNWEMNQSKTIQDFINEPEVKYILNSWGEIERTVSTFHYLCGLDLDDICDEFNAMNNNATDWDWDADAYGVSFHAGGYLDALEAEIEYTFNTYNGDSDLSQIIQGSRLLINNEVYFLVQVHGGCDARGGYTNARLFKANHWSEWIHEYIMEYMDKYQLASEIEYVDVFDTNGKKVSKKRLQKILEA